MKNLVIFLLIMAFKLDAQMAQICRPITVVNVYNPMCPLVILDHFNRNFPSASPEWSIKGKYYVVSYSDPETNLGRIITYTKHGTVLRIQCELLYSYPETIDAYFIKKYPEEPFSIWASVDESGNFGYYSIRKSKMICFDQEGNYIYRKHAE